MSSMQVFYNLALVRPHVLSDHCAQFVAAAENFPKAAPAAVQVVCAVARVKKVTKT